ncbi:MAG: hypothetical protein NWE92_13600 [Candidatus Bathyarchaeota archaeon]|nr:hypothetical protein [Candidatus Bathyarchaeota archaeon]
MEDHAKTLLVDFLKNSWDSIEALVKQLPLFKAEHHPREVTLCRCINGERVEVLFLEDKFFLRGSVEYSNPQLTVEEIQGIVGIRLLEACGNYFDEVGLHQPDNGDIEALVERLKQPPKGYIVPFLLNTDDVEADRYSINPLRHSIMDSGQSAFPAANIKTDNLKIDADFTKKYENKLITKKDLELINEKLDCCKGSYLDFVDSVKYRQLDELSEVFGVNFGLYVLRLPLSMLKTENKDGLMHHIISESHRDYEAINEAYTCMGRSMTKRTTLLTIPHSPKGFGSKRAARGKLHFEGNKLKEVVVKYKTTVLYPNAADPQDVAVAICDDDFTVSGEKLANYSFAETPSSPQFFLYSMGSPEDGAVWHGVGVFASPLLLQSYTAARKASIEGRLIKDLTSKYHVRGRIPLQFNLAPEQIWRHPTYQNIDASVSCIDDLSKLVREGMKVDYLAEYK